MLPKIYTGETAARTDRERATGADLLQQAGAHELSDDPLGRVALNARRQFNSAIYASGASPSRLICRAVAPVVVGRPGKAPFWTRLRYSLNALKLQDRNVALARSESSKRSSRLLKNYFRGFSLEILQVAARHSVPALTDLPASASWWPQNNAGTDKVSCPTFG